MLVTGLLDPLNQPVVAAACPIQALNDSVDGRHRSLQRASVPTALQKSAAPVTSAWPGRTICLAGLVSTTEAPERGLRPSYCQL